MWGGVRRMWGSWWLLLCWAALGLCAAGLSGPHTVHHPAPHGQGALRIRLPDHINDRGRRICTPSPENCRPGYYRVRSGLYRSQCLPCRCNGLADQCEDGTGRCLNCRYNTAGDHCERCKDGYYGNAFQKTCHVCPCPFTSRSNSFAVSCKELADGFECVCKPGYMGPRCERCALGYYGNPMAFRGICLPCKCDTGICDSRTGECINTVDPNDPSDGSQCQECDSCVQALMDDLEGLDDELELLKSRLRNISGDANSQEALRKLEKAIAAIKVKVKELEADVSSLSEDIRHLREKADRTVQKAHEVVKNTNDTHQRAADVLSEAKDLLQGIQDLLEQLKGVNSSGNVLPSGEMERMLTEARRMVREMELRNCTAQRDAAEREREEARKLLNYIENNMTEPQANVQGMANRIGALFNRSEAKLKDLEEALKQADRAVGKAVNHNQRNADALEDLLLHSKQLGKKRDKVAGQIATTKDQLRKSAGLLKTLQDIKSDYEGLAAQLDGAKTDLIRKVNNISRAASKEAIVVRAEEHARELERLATEWQEMVKNASSSQDMRHVMDAIQAYNITNMIGTAEELANRAKEMANTTLRDVVGENVPERAQDLKDRANTLLEEAKNAQTDFKNSTDEQKAQRKRIDQAQEKNGTLLEDLLSPRKQLDKIRRDDIVNTLNATKSDMASLNDTLNNALARLDALRENVDVMNVTSPDLNFDGFLDDLNKTVTRLDKSIPLLQNQTEHVGSQVPNISSNVSESIRRVKELIEQARDAANRIPVPVDFGGDGHVELRPPADLEDLKAYTAMALTLQRPLARSKENRGRRRRQNGSGMFVMYLGNKNSPSDYIGMALKQEELHCIYSLGGAEHEMKLGLITESSSETAVWDRIDFHRIYQDAKAVFSKAFTSNNKVTPLNRTAQGGPDKTLLNLDPKQVVFYVGGYPGDFDPPQSLRYPMYKGCIEFSTLNDRFISLYNFRNASNVNTQRPCTRPSPSKKFKCFEGIGYGREDISRPISANIYRFTQSVISQSENALLFYIGNQDSYYSLSVERGYMIMRRRDGSNTLSEHKSADKEFPLPDMKEVQVIFQGRSKSILIRINGREVITANYTPGSYESYYIGGLPQFLREKDNITTPPFKGCMSNIKQDDKIVEFDEEIGIGMECPERLLAIRESMFRLGGSLSAAPRGFGLTGNVMVSVGFRSTENEGILLKNTQGANGIELSLKDGFVIFKFKNKAWRSNKTYKDGKWHYVTAVKNGSRIELRVDEDDLGRQESQSSGVSANGQEVVLGKGTFHGCLTNLYMRRPDNLYWPENLSAFNSTGDVLLGVSPAEQPPQSMVASHDHDGERNYLDTGHTRAAKSSKVYECSLPTPVKHTHHLGGPASYLAYNVPTKTLNYRPHFSLAFRTMSSDGLLFFIGGNNTHMALYISKGRIKLSAGRNRPITHKAKCNDGKWHHVEFSLEKETFHMLFDGMRTEDGVVSGTDGYSMGLQPPVYLGVIPSSTNAENQVESLPTNSVVGCIRNFRMHDQRLEEPIANHGTLPCFSGTAETGAYFSGNQGYAVLGKYPRVPQSFSHMDITFQLEVEVRPRDLTGVLFHVAAYGGDHMTLYLRSGEVVLQVNAVAGVFTVPVMQKNLCDGRFHHVAVTRKKNHIELKVDMQVKQTRAPQSSTTAIKTGGPIYAGGIPDSLQVTKLPVRSSFVGCMRNIRINKKDVSFDEKAQVFGPVNLEECPTS